MNGTLKAHLEAARDEIRGAVAEARTLGEEAHSKLSLNGMADLLPQGLVNAIVEVQKLYAEANAAAERVLREQLGGV